MAKTIINTNLEAKGAGSRLINFSLPTDTEANILNMTFPNYLGDGKPICLYYYASDTERVWVYSGARGWRLAGGGLKFADPDNEGHTYSGFEDLPGYEAHTLVYLGLYGKYYLSTPTVGMKELALTSEIKFYDNPPIDTWDGVNWVPGVDPNLSMEEGSLALLGWIGEHGTYIYTFGFDYVSNTFVYRQVSETPCITIEVTSHISSISPLRPNTYYRRMPSREEWYVDANGGIRVIRPMRVPASITFQQVLLLANVPYEFSINNTTQIRAEDGYGKIEGVNAVPIDHWSLMAGVTVFEGTTNITNSVVINSTLMLIAQGKFTVTSATQRSVWVTFQGHLRQT